MVVDLQDIHTELRVVEQIRRVSWLLVEDTPGTLDMDVVVQAAQEVLVVAVDVVVAVLVLVALHL